MKAALSLTLIACLVGSALPVAAQEQKTRGHRGTVDFFKKLIRQFDHQIGQRHLVSEVVCREQPLTLAVPREGIRLLDDVPDARREHGRGQ